MKVKPYIFPAFIAVVTLLLQVISFATTWQGAAVYLESIFPLASLLFAVAVQATVWFFSNSLRHGIRPQRLLALALAVCCSTYFSYIGICNAVNPVQRYLLKSYTQIYTELNAKAEAAVNGTITAVTQSLNNAYSYAASIEQKLLSAQERHKSLAEELVALTNTKTNSLRTPSRGQYENYEDYVTAYRAYIAGVGEAGQLESSANRQQLLAFYGYASMEEYLAEEGFLTAALAALAESSLSEELHAADAVSALSEDTLSGLEELYHYYEQAKAFDKDSSYEQNVLSLNEVTELIQKSIRYRAGEAMPDYQTLLSSLPGGRVTNRNLMELKTAMDSAVAAQLMQLALLLPGTSVSLPAASDYQIADIYLLPIRYLTQADFNSSAYYCLLLAGLIDGLTLLFSLSLLRKKPSWHRQYLHRLDAREWETQMEAYLPGSREDFLAPFTLCSALEERDGYVMGADLSQLQAYLPLLAVLSQTGMVMLQKERVLLKPSFLYWAGAKATDSLTEPVPKLPANIRAVQTAE